VSTDLRLMAVHAHPDDESSKGAATMARYVHEGVDVLVVTCTGGERGDVLNPAMDRPEVWAELATLRNAEMARAREILGVRQAWLGFVDSGYLKDYTPERVGELPDGSFARVPVERAAEPLVRLMREFQPQVVTTYDENGGYPHADHIMCHTVTLAAFEAAGDAARYPDAGAVWQPSKLYYDMGFNRDAAEALHSAALAAGLESPYQWMMDNPDFGREKSKRVTTRVPCAEFFPVRDEALRAHATQVDPDGPWFRLPLEIRQKAWPTEDFELVRSTVPTTLPEDDLFAGLR
jgi:mycothiol S-conjugate amidase